MKREETISSAEAIAALVQSEEGWLTSSTGFKNAALISSTSSRSDRPFRTSRSAVRLLSRVTSTAIANLCAQVLRCGVRTPDTILPFGMTKLSPAKWAH
jgi:hypothetical protein